MRRLRDVGSLCSRSNAEFHECLYAILDTGIFSSNAEKGNLQLLDASSGALRIAVQRGFESPFLSFFAKVTKEEAAACGRAMNLAAPVVVEDVNASELFAGTDALRVLLEAGVRAVVSTPLVSSSGTVLGMISTHFAQPHRPGEREQRLMELLVRQAGDFLERREAESALRAASERQQQFIEAVPTGITHCSRDLRYLAANATYAAIAGLPVEQIVGRSIAEVMGSTAWTKIRPYVDRVLMGERVEYEASVPFRAGGFRRIHVVYTPERDSSNQVIGWFASITDIADFRRMEENLHRAEKLAAAGQLAASLAHEINNPLSAVTNILYLLETGEHRDPEVVTLAKTASAELARVSRIVRQSLSYYRADAAPKEIDLGPLVQESLRVLGTKLQHSNVVVRTKIEKPARITGYTDEIRQAVDNLLHNSLDALPQGGKIAVSVRRSRTWDVRTEPGVRLTIADDGCGIAKRHFAYVSEPFFTTKADKGTGLGLWVVRGIVSRHGGSMKIRSSDRQPGNGTTVSILWPASIATQPAPGLAKSAG